MNCPIHNHENEIDADSILEHILRAREDIQCRTMLNPTVIYMNTSMIDIMVICSRENLQMNVDYFNTTTRHMIYGMEVRRILDNDTKPKFMCVIER